MKKVFKYSLLTSENVLDMPEGAQVLSAHVQGTTVCIWALVDPGKPTERRTFRVYGTGHEMDDGITFIGTVMAGPFVWHVFEDRR